MKYLLRVVLAVLLVSGVGAQTSVEQEMERIERELQTSILKSDPSVSERYLADTVVITTPDGDVLDKSRAIADIKSGNLKLQSSNISDMKVRVYGDTAVVSFRTTDKGTYNKRVFSGQYRWTDVFMKQGGNWKLVASHGTPAQRP
jgi:ketosteroid isomerase-like protein